MGQRRPGLTRAGFRRVGAAPAAGGVTSVISSDGSIAVTNPTGPAVDVEIAGRPAVANWTLGLCRVYAIDGTNGVDGHLGYADPATSSTADYAVACAAAGAVAVKTFAGLAAILPLNGAGRTCEIVILGGGVTYAGGLQTFMAGVSGYLQGLPCVRGTVTSTTASCTAFDGSANDCLMDGGLTGPGMNAAGYRATGAPTTTVVQMLTAAGGAPGFGAEPGLPGGLRIRFDAACTTVALRNIVRPIGLFTTDTFTFATALPAAPSTVAGADPFYIEVPGIICGATSLATADVVPTGQGQISGIDCTGAMTIRDSRFHLSFSRFASFSASSGLLIDFAFTNVHPVRGSLTVGDVRVTGNTVWTASRMTTATSYMAGSLDVAYAVSLLMNGSFTVGTGLRVSGISYGGAIIGSSTVGTPGPRILGAAGFTAGLIVNGFSGNLVEQVVITNAGAKPAWKIDGAGLGLQIGFNITTGSTVSGSTGNTDVGLDMTAARGCTLFFNTTTMPTVTGTNGDVRLPNGTIVTWATIAAGMVDSAGNRYVCGPRTAGDLGGTVPVLFTGSLVSSAVGATLTYLANPGTLLAAANLVLQQRYPVGLAFVIRGLTVNVRAGALGNACAVTLYKNGAATAVTLNIPAGSAVNTRVSAAAGLPLVFVPGDDFDLRMDDALDAGAGTLTISACLAVAV